jgi:hypothetical protein
MSGKVRFSRQADVCTTVANKGAWLHIATIAAIPVQYTAGEDAEVNLLRNAKVRLH